MEEVWRRLKGLDVEEWDEEFPIRQLADVIVSGGDEARGAFANEDMQWKTKVLERCVLLLNNKNESTKRKIIVMTFLSNLALHRGSRDMILSYFQRIEDVFEGHLVDKEEGSRIFGTSSLSPLHVLTVTLIARCMDYRLNSNLLTELFSGKRALALQAVVAILKVYSYEDDLLVLMGSLLHGLSNPDSFFHLNPADEVVSVSGKGLEEFMSGMDETVAYCMSSSVFQDIILAVSKHLRFPLFHSANIEPGSLCAVIGEQLSPRQHVLVSTLCHFTLNLYEFSSHSRRENWRQHVVVATEILQALLLPYLWGCLALFRTYQSVEVVHPAIRQGILMALKLLSIISYHPVDSVYWLLYFNPIPALLTTCLSHAKQASALCCVILVNCDALSQVFVGEDDSLHPCPSILRDVHRHATSDVSVVLETVSLMGKNLGMDHLKFIRQSLLGRSASLLVDAGMTSHPIAIRLLTPAVVAALETPGIDSSPKPSAAKVEDEAEAVQQPKPKNAANDVASEKVTQKETKKVKEVKEVSTKKEEVMPESMSQSASGSLLGELPSLGSRKALVAADSDAYAHTASSAAKVADTVKVHRKGKKPSKKDKNKESKPTEQESKIEKERKNESSSATPESISKSESTSSDLSGQAQAAPPKYLTCALNGTVLKNPVRSPYGHVFEKGVIELYLQKQGNTCPFTCNPLMAYQLKRAEDIERQLQRYAIQQAIANNETEYDLYDF
jgi:hypothetical protein